LLRLQSDARRPPLVYSIPREDECVAQKKTFQFSPPVLMSSIPADRHEWSLVMLDVTANNLDENRTRLDVNVAVRGVALRDGNSTKCFIGCESIAVVLTAATGHVVDSTREMTLPVTRRTKKTEARKSTLTLKPELSAKAGKVVEASVSLGNASVERGHDSELESEYQTSERMLAPVRSDRVVEWAFDPPKGSVTRDYIQGNLDLFAVCQWGAEPKIGKIEVRPEKWRMYAADDKRPLGAFKALLVGFLLRDLIDRVEARDGIVVSFKETQA
jgi:hypothetical protein